MQRRIPVRLTYSEGKSFVIYATVGQVVDMCGNASLQPIYLLPPSLLIPWPWLSLRANETKVCNS